MRALATTALALALWCGSPAVAASKAAVLTVPWRASKTIEVRATGVADPQATPAAPGRVVLHRARRVSSGEGILALTMDAPGTSWASARDTAAIAEVSVDGGPAQSIELFYGASAFTYEGFLGPLSAGRHRLTILDSPLSDARDAAPIRIASVQLGIVAPSDPGYLQLAHAPVIYGRSSSPHGYIPLLTYGQQQGTRLSYTYVISAHDQGDSIVPAYQWGTWGRMTDIVGIMSETVAPDGSVRDATYSSCSCEGTPYPDGVQAPSDTTVKPFTGRWLGHHPVLRDATATNYLSDQGTTPYVFQQVPVAGPEPGQVREAVMDTHPWTYRVSNQELPREHLISTSPDNLLVGDYRQYAIVDSDVSQTGAAGIEFELRLAGDPTWYTTDYAQMSGGVPSTFVFHDGGHNRTVIKLPLDWGRRAITGLRMRLTVKPGGGTATATVHSLEVLEVTSDFGVVARRLPNLSVVQGPALDPGPLPV